MSRGAVYMLSKRLADVLSGPVLKNDPELAGLLYEAERDNDAILFIPDFVRNSTEYIHPSIEQLFGYSVSEMISGGIPLIALLTVETEFPRLSALQSAYAQQAQEITFDPDTVVVQQYSWRAIHKKGHAIEVTSIGVILQYTEHREFGLAVGFIIENRSRLKEIIERCSHLLTRIKERHSKIYEQPAFRPQLPYIHNYLNNKYQPISIREREVLHLLAQGLSTKELSAKLGISTHTAESHRKHLLGKFNARNSVELVMKASKIYWFGEI